MKRLKAYYVFNRAATITLDAAGKAINELLVCERAGLTVLVTVAAYPSGIPEYEGGPFPYYPAIVVETCAAFGSQRESQMRTALFDLHMSLVRHFQAPCVEYSVE